MAVSSKLCLNHGQQERIRGRNGISVLLVNHRAVLSPRPNVKGSTRKRGPGPPHHPRVTHLVSHPSSSLSGEVGRGLHGRTGRATSWAARGPIRPHKDRKSARAITEEIEKSNDVHAFPTLTSRLGDRPTSSRRAPPRRCPRFPPPMPC